MPNFEISISVPITSNSMTEVIKATAGFSAELEALKQKLPENASYKDGITRLREGKAGPRKTMAERVAEGVAAELAKRPESVGLTPAAEPSPGPRVPRGVHAA